MTSWNVIFRDQAGKICSAVYEAESRKDVFSALKNQGIAPIRIEEARGNSGGHLKLSRKLIVFSSLFVLLLCVVISFVNLSLKNHDTHGVDSNLNSSSRSGSNPIRIQVPVNEPKGVIKGVALTGKDDLSASSKIVEPTTNEQVKVSYGPDDLLNQMIAKGKRPLFRHQSDIWFSQFVEPGVRVPPIPINANLKDSFIASLTDPIEFSDEDSDLDRLVKEEVSNMRKQAAEWIKSGKTFEDYMTELQTRQEKEATKVEVVREVLLTSFREDEDPNKTIELWQAFNKKMSEEGLRPIKLPAPIKIKLVKQGIKVSQIEEE